MTTNLSGISDSYNSDPKERDSRKGAAAVPCLAGSCGAANALTPIKEFYSEAALEMRQTPNEQTDSR